MLWNEAQLHTNGEDLQRRLLKMSLLAQELEEQKYVSV
jgi:hypothetical protein